MTTEYFDRLYQESPDPWDLETSDYERRKYALSIAALRGHRFANVLEVGCSIGAFTERLADHCQNVTAIDASLAAVLRARERTGSRPGVIVERRRFPDELPDGPFDLVVCSEVLYYCDETLLREGLSRLRGVMVGSGSLLAVHWRGPVHHYPLDGDRVHAILAQELADMTCGFSMIEPLFRIDRYDSRT
jgi:SAM-dependent methyltransferase